MMYAWLENKHNQYLTATISDSDHPSKATIFDLFSFKDGTTSINYIKYENIKLPIDEAFCFQSGAELEFLVENCTALLTFKFLEVGRQALRNYFANLNIETLLNVEETRFLGYAITSFINTDISWVQYKSRPMFYNEYGMTNRFMKYLERFLDSSYHNCHFPTYFPVTLKLKKEQLEKEKELEKQKKLFLITKNIDSVVTEYVATVIGTSIEDVKSRYKMRSNIYVTLIDEVNGMTISLQEK